ncbi:hypothetical protein M877_36095 [Streptomyces niveus NCIMB 11891]|nr:hypothetical protein M877_36095 [Streptomyces niveus NCIMB 11891]
MCGRTQLGQERARSSSSATGLSIGTRTGGYSNCRAQVSPTVLRSLAAAARPTSAPLARQGNRSPAASLTVRRTVPWAAVDRS